MLVPNWAGHDIETNTIVNYFTDRQYTELILRKIKKKNRDLLLLLQRLQELEKAIQVQRSVQNAWFSDI